MLLWEMKPPRKHPSSFHGLSKSPDAKPIFGCKKNIGCHDLDRNFNKQILPFLPVLLESTQYTCTHWGEHLPQWDDLSEAAHSSEGCGLCYNLVYTTPPEKEGIPLNQCSNGLRCSPLGAEDERKTHHGNLDPLFSYRTQLLHIIFPRKITYMNWFYWQIVFHWMWTVFSYLKAFTVTLPSTTLLHDHHCFNNSYFF